MDPTTPSVLLDIQDLQTHFYVRGGMIRAVDEVSLTMAAGRTLGLVGESGCGKSVTAASIMGLIPQPPGKIAGGRILFQGQDLVGLPEREMRKIRGNRISMIFQEPMTSLNPVFTVGDQVSEVYRVHRKSSRREARDLVIEMFQTVGIPAPERRVDDYPYQMSGGMRQRVMIAMALACRPRLMIADEPTTALDVTIQAQILDLMNRLKDEIQTSILFITHDLGVIAEMADHVAVMYAGKMVEYSDVRSIFGSPMHPYTVGLLKSIPVVGRVKRRDRLPTIPGVVPSLFRLPPGCLFADRCPAAFDRCQNERPGLYAVTPTHCARCFQYE
jgi:peptide/nickel transport system ATP-binding protein/oligopeptide transport system ATP-binding protein